MIVEFALFGSVLRDNFDSSSDVDVLVRFSPNSDWSLLDEAAMEQELEEILGRSVDLVDRSVIEQSKNPIRKKEILSSAQTFYVER
jgi:predicted nucleotidyltransferase